MRLRYIRFVFLLVLISFFQACSLNKTTIKSIAQTSSASQIEEYKIEVLKALIKYKNKLDLRNPYTYNKSIKKDIIHQIQTQQDYINIIQDNEKLKDYNQYLHYAFSDKRLSNRSDFLVLGLYKLIYKAFLLNEGHQFAAIQYDKEQMQRLYKYLQVVRWKIKTAKDKNGEYLYKTWQNNWQLELAKKDDSNLNIIKELKYIKSKKESIYDSSNFSFELLISKMLINIEHILKKINVEPYEMGISALKSFVFII